MMASSESESAELTSSAESSSLSDASSIFEIAAISTEDACSGAVARAALLAATAVGRSSGV